LAVAYGGVAWWVVFSQRWGPVVAVIDERAGMGVHSGDIVGVLAGLMALLCALFAAVLADEALGLGLRVATARVAHRAPAPRAPRAAGDVVAGRRAAAGRPAVPAVAGR
jgi:hypothetical protein